MKEAGRLIRSHRPTFTQDWNHEYIQCGRDYLFKIGGNCSIDEANIIFLGEVHEPWAKYVVGDFVNKYARQGDIVLVERVAFGEKPPIKEIQPYNFTDKVKIFGWDDMTLVESVYRLREEKNEVKKELEKMRKLKCEKDEVDRFESEINFLCEKEWGIMINQRNLSLIRAFKSTRKQFPYEQIFLSAGNWHFKEDSHIVEELEQDKYFALETVNNLAKYVYPGGFGP